MDNIEKENNDDFIEQLERKIYDLRNLIGLGISLSSNLDFESLVESILYSCIGQMFIEKVAILLQVDIDVSNFYIHMAKGFDDILDNQGIVLQENSGLLNYCDKNPYPHDYQKLSEIKTLSNDLEKLSIMSPKLIVPMKSKNSLNGMIILGEQNDR